MSLPDFQHSSIGRKVHDLIADTATIRRMEELSRLGQPAVGAIDERLPRTTVLDNTQRQYIGRWVKEVMAERGWKTTIQRRLADGRVLTSGMHYVRIAAVTTNGFANVPSELLPVEERIARAQAIVRQSGIADLSVAHYLAQKPDEADEESSRFDADAAR